MKTQFFNRSISSWAFRLVAASIMLQTLYFKFSGAEESIYIFKKVGMEPWGRYGAGTAELIAALVLLVNPVSWFGSLFAAAIMSGAIISHLTVLGIKVQGDGGLLFGLACTVFVTSLINLYLERAHIPILGRILSGQRS